jgi:hypothetical protein
MSAARLPEFFIVGSPKTGTTALYEMLKEHPHIYMPALKEPHFLASEMKPRPEFAEQRNERLLPRTLEKYLALFDDAAPRDRVGEASAFYLWSPTAADRIADLQPDARIIAILREPASFLRSLHLLFLRWGVENEKDLRKAISLDPSRRDGKSLPARSHRPQLLQYADHVCYVDQLRRFHARLPPEQILVLIYDDFRRDNDATVKDVLRFLDVDEQSPIQPLDTNVTTRTQRSYRARYFLMSLRGRSPVARSVRRTVRRLTTQRVRRGALDAFQRHVVSASAPPPDETVMSELRQRFKPEVVALSEYLDRDLVRLWGYDEFD